MDITGSDVAVTTPVATIHYGEVVEAANSAYSDVDGMAGLGSDDSLETMTRQLY